MSQCKECNSTDHYNFELNIGLCNPCIGKRLERLQAENEKLKEALDKINILNADKNGDIKWLIEQARKETNQ